MKYNPKYSINHFLIFFLLLGIIFLYSCDTATQPNIKKSLRDYTWTIDTLNVPDAFQNLMLSMYAPNPKDIYLVGHNNSSDPNGGMWHYDGETWKTVKLKEEVGPYGSLVSVNGSSPNNIWAVGGTTNTTSTFLQYNGVLWKKHLGKTPNGVFDAPISNNDIYYVDVESETEVWACGDGGLVYHYDGNNWDIDTIKIELNENEVFPLYNIVKYNGDIYCTGYKRDKTKGAGEIFLLKKNNDNWDIIEKESYGYGPSDLNLRLYLSKYNKLYSIGTGGVTIRENNEWKNIFFLESSINCMSVESNNNILIAGSFAKVFHFDGRNWEQLTDLELPDVMYIAVKVFNNEAFIIGKVLGNFPQKTIVIHGK